LRKKESASNKQGRVGQTMIRSKHQADKITHTLCLDTFRESGPLRQFLFVSSVAELEKTLLIFDSTDIESMSNAVFIMWGR
jgi:hypothetical protein